MAKNYKTEFQIAVMTKDAFLSKKSLQKELVQLDDKTGLYIQQLTGDKVEKIADMAQMEKSLAT